MRVYIPGTVADLPLYGSGSWEPSEGFGVTPRLLEISAHDDQELLAEQARDAAATASVAEFGSALRLVVVVDYPRADVTPAPDEHPAAVHMVGRVMADAIACVFVDEPEAAADARDAAAGDLEALGRLDERTMLWFDTSEMDLIEAP